MFLSRIRSYARLSAVRLTLSLLGVFAAVTVLAWVSTFVMVDREMKRLVEARLLGQASLITQALESGTELPASGFGQNVAVISQNGVQGGLPFRVPDRPDGVYYYDRAGPDFRYLIRTLPTGEIIQVSENVERQDELLDTLIGGIHVSLLVLLLAGLLAALWLAARGQQRVDIVSKGLADVANGNLKTRITLPGRQDDLSILAERINATTAQLDHSMEQMRVQSSNIAHDLRTPLARLRAGIETSLIDLTERNQPVEADDLGTALEQIDHIVGTFNALLRLARVESGAGKNAFELVDLGELAEHVAETFAPVVEDAGQELTVKITQSERVSGDRDLLVQLVANLIQNALRYGAPDQVIDLAVHRTSLSVSDQGPGIPIDERKKVLQPLYQLEKTRQNSGFGLGLSMVAAISDLHGAVLDLTDVSAGHGLKVTLQFPRITNS